ncbi:MAG: hypothetical protein GXX95_00935 [Methanomassiliicoccus sp.]|nr:hypothetical protein [Methanomassiliicoccus sp.]
MKRILLSITLPPSVLSRVDNERGLIPRTRYIESLITYAMKENAPMPKASTAIPGASS